MSQFIEKIRRGTDQRAPNTSWLHASTGASLQKSQPHPGSGAIWRSHLGLLGITWVPWVPSKVGVFKIHLLMGTKLTSVGFSGFPILKPTIFRTSFRTSPTSRSNSGALRWGPHNCHGHSGTSGHSILDRCRCEALDSQIRGMGPQGPWGHGAICLPTYLSSQFWTKPQMSALMSGVSWPMRKHMETYGNINITINIT